MNIKAKIIISGLLIFNSISNAQIYHVEPLNWWVGMKNPNLQLLINGTDIGETEPSINYAGVSIKKVNKADSKNYLFLDLVIAKTAKPGTFPINFKKQGKVVASHSYSLLGKQSDPLKIKGFNSADAIYLIVPDRFANGDSSNDVVAGMKENKINRKFDGGRHGGDLRGIINNLDYIKEMGFTAIWPTPVLENDMPEYSYHGYAITNHYKVDPRYGTIEDYKELAQKAKQKGIKLVFDEVLNHSGSGYWWMSDFPFKDWLNFQEGYQPTNHRRVTNQDLYASQYDKDFWAKGWFDKGMPDMNGKNPFMANYLIQCSLWWIETLQLGGIRQDTYGYSDKTLLKNWSCRIMDEYPNFNMVGEEWSVNPLIEAYWQKGKKNHDGYQSCLPALMDFPLQSALTQGLKEPETTDMGKGISRVYDALANDFVYANPKNILVFADNHDMDRIFTQMDNDVDLTRMALTYLATTRGIPQMLYGTEILMENSAAKTNHGIIRSDFPGGWAGDTINGFSGLGLNTVQFGFQEYIKTLLNWRKANPVIANGKTMHFAPFNGVYAYFRFDDKKMVMVLMNNNRKESSVDARRFAEIVGTRTTAKNIISNEEIGLSAPIVLPARSALVFELK